MAEDVQISGIMLSDSSGAKEARIAVKIMYGVKYKAGKYDTYDCTVRSDKKGRRVYEDEAQVVQHVRH